MSATVGTTSTDHVDNRCYPGRVAAEGFVVLEDGAAVAPLVPLVDVDTRVVGVVDELVEVVEVVVA